MGLLGPEPYARLIGGLAQPGLVARALAPPLGGYDPTHTVGQRRRFPSSPLWPCSTSPRSGRCGGHGNPATPSEPLEFCTLEPSVRTAWHANTAMRELGRLLWRLPRLIAWRGWPFALVQRRHHLLHRFSGHHHGDRLIVRTAYPEDDNITTVDELVALETTRWEEPCSIWTLDDHVWSSRTSTRRHTENRMPCGPRPCRMSYACDRKHLEE